MARTTETNVKAILDGYTADITTITPFLTAANLWVTQVFEGDGTLTDALLAEIEKWLTAHMVSCTIHRTASKEALGDASVSYTGYWSKNLESTSYGQMVLMLDVTGKAGRMGKLAASMYAVKDTD